ncbi:uncharacterized protein LOC135575962 isoform X3 [Columba livia]|uniref:uncharacterized protein LOC135575962 isoform X3 n=1 Tax=Columba livia TaxID=8932 RepID=UPI0031BBB371
MTRGRPGEAAGGPALCGRGAHGVEGFLGAPRGFLWRDSSSRSHRHGDGRGPLARGLSSLEPGPGTRSRGVRKSRGGAVTAPVLSRPPSPGGGSSAGAGDAAPSSVPSVPGGGCRPVGRGCGCSGHCPPIFGGSEQPNVLLKVVVVRVRDPQAVPRPQDGCWWNKVKDNFSETQRWSEFPSTRVCVQPGTLGERVRAGRRLNGRAVSDCGTSWGCFDRVQPSFSPRQPALLRSVQ